MAVAYHASRTTAIARSDARRMEGQVHRAVRGPGSNDEASVALSRLMLTAVSYGAPGRDSHGIPSLSASNPFGSPGAFASSTALASDQ